MISLLLIISLVNSTPLIAIIPFESKGVPPEETVLLTNTLKSDLGKQFTITSDEVIKSLGLSKTKNIRRAIEVGKSANLTLVLYGSLAKVGELYKTKLFCVDPSKELIDTLTLLNNSVDTLAILLSNYITQYLAGAEEKNYGSVFFNTDPSGADILLDGELLGTTPEKIDFIPFGEHSVFLSKKGYTTAIKLIVVFPERTTSVSMSLSPVLGSFISGEVPVYLIDEVVVRGKKLREKLFDIPKGVEIIPKDVIARSGAKDIPTLLSQLAGVSIKDPTGSGVSAALSIRGMDPSKYTTVTLDGVVINKISGEVNWNSIPIELVKRIEVIKGSPAMYGGKAAGGIINIITKESEKSKILLYSTNAKDIGGSITLSASDNWSLWINTSGRRGDGWRNDEHYDLRSIYSKFSLPLDAESDIFISLEAQMNENELPGGLTMLELNTPKISGIDKEVKCQQGIKLMSGYEFSAKGGSGNTYDTKFALRFHTMPEVYESQILGIKHKMDGVNVGGNSTLEKGNFTGGLNIDYVMLKQAAASQDSSNDSYTFDIRTTMEWQERFYGLIMIPGMSYQWIGYWLQQGIIAGSQKTKYLSSLTPTLGLMWSIPTIEIFGSFEQALKLPEGYEKVKNIELEPEKLTPISGGIRLRKPQMAGSISLFYINIEDPIIVQGNSYINSNDAYHKGIEGDIELRPVEEISWFLNYTQLEAKYKGTNDWLPGIPEREASFGIRVSKMPLYSFVGTYNWHGKSYVESEQIASYSTCDCNFKYRISPTFELGIGSTNLLKTTGASFGYKRDNITYYYPIPAQGFRVELSAQF